LIISILFGVKAGSSDPVTAIMAVASKTTLGMAMLYLF